MRKTIVLLIALCCMFSLAACAQARLKGKPKGNVGLSGGGTTDPFAPILPAGLAADGSGTVMDTEYPNTTGYTITPVASGDNLQNRIDNANCGTILKLQAGAVFSGNFHFPTKDVGHNGPCDSTKWIILQSDDCNNSGSCTHLPAQHTRVQQSDATYMATLKEVGGGFPVIDMSRDNWSNSTHTRNWRFVGIEVFPDNIDHSAVCFVPVVIGWSNETDIANSPDRIVFDRVYIHGADSGNAQYLNEGLYAGSVKAIGIVDSEISRIHVPNCSGEGYALSVLQYEGPVKIVNNEIQGGTITLALTMASYDPYTDKSWLWNKDTEIRFNHINKKLSERGLYFVKGLFEFKSAHRTLVEGNILDYNWFQGQDYAAVTLKSLSQDNGCRLRCWSSDLTFRYNIIRHTNLALGISAGRDGSSISGGFQPPIDQQAARYLITDNLFQDQDPAVYSYSNTPSIIGTASDSLLYDTGLNHITIDHNTFAAQNTAIGFLPGMSGNQTVCDPLASPLQRCWTSSRIRNNVFTDDGNSAVKTNYLPIGYSTVYGDDAMRVIREHVGDVIFSGNVMAGTVNALPSDNATCNGATCQPTLAGLGMTNVTNCIGAVSVAACKLANATTYKGVATDCAARTAAGLSCDPGADPDVVAAKTSCALTGVNCR